MNLNNSLKEKSLNTFSNDSKIPNHVAIIMDGNGRWAKNHSFGRIRGHRQGIRAIRETIKAAINKNVKFLTLYAFSTENWSRPKNEVDALWNILIEFLDKEVPKLKKKDVTIKAIGRLNEIPKDAYSKLKWGIKETETSKGLNLILALNYGGRQEITDAFNKVLKEKKDFIKENDIAKYLYTSEYPDPDLLIRTSGEKRLSNFLLWQLSYAEMVFLDVLWPDFNEVHFYEALEEYKKRQRRFGGV